MNATSINADPAELEKFGALAHRWWDPKSEFRPLHEMNPVRTQWIDQSSQLNRKKVVDIGCGGGLLTEGMARLGATVTGIDLSDRPLSVARLHLHESGLQIDYRKIAAEFLAAEQPASFDIVTCMEMLEHVPSPQSIVRSCATLAKPGASVYFSTINRNLKAYALAIFGAEYALGLLPRGTHDYQRFIKPAELSRWCRESGLIVEEIIGMKYNPFNHHCSLSSDSSVNYMVRTRRE